MSQMKSFNVIVEDVNHREFIPYDVIPYFIRRYRALKKGDKKPVTFDEFKKCIEDWSMYEFWCRCEYEIILSGWPPAKEPHDDDKKIDVHWQVMMNIDVITEIVMDECLNDSKKRKK